MASKWFCKISGQNIGPMSSKELKAMAEAGQLTPQHLVRRGNKGKWVPAIHVGGLFGGKPDKKSRGKQTITVDDSDEDVAQSKRSPKQPAGAQPRRARRPIPTNKQPAAEEPAAAAAGGAVNPFGIVADDSSPSTRVSSRGRSSRSGAHAVEGGKGKNQNMLIFGSIGVLGLAGIIAIIVVMTRQETPVAQTTTQPGAAAPAAPIDPEAGKIEDLDNPGGDAGGGGGDAVAVAAPVGDDAAGGEEEVSDEGYADASAGGVTVGDYKIKVVTAESGIPSFVRRPAKMEDEYFIVTVKVYNEHEGKRMPYKSWSEKGGGSPRLVDDYENNYVYQKNCVVDGVETDSRIDPGDSVKEIFVFEALTGKQNFVLLDLPGTPVSSATPIRFKIPTSMITEAAPPAEQPDAIAMPAGDGDRPRRREKPSGGGNQTVDDVIRGIGASSTEDPITAAQAKHVDDDEEEVKVIHVPGENKGPDTGDDLLDQLSNQHGF